MQEIGFILAAGVGISLGLIGGGGSILTVPILVYIMGVSPLMATSYSLFIVGVTSLVGAFNSYRKGFVQVKTALLFGLSSVTTVFLTRKMIIPFIPKNIATLGGVMLTENMLTMVLFAILMLFASISMIRTGSIPGAGKKQEAFKPDGVHLFKLILYGIGIGLATGFLGAGGGFLLIPTLVLLLGLTMKQAIGTSLFIIALNSLIGFTGDLGHFQMDWIFLGKITTITIAGIIAGGYWNKKIPGEKLKKVFGFFVLIMGVLILVKEIFLH
jgi:uncharacterized protein